MTLIDRLYWALGVLVTGLGITLAAVIVTLGLLITVCVGIEWYKEKKTE